MKTLTSLLERLNLDPEVLEACARNAEALGLPLERALYEAERINENQYLETAAARHAMPCELRLAALMDKEGSGWATDAERVCKVPLPWLRKQKVVPVRDKDGKLALAICHPSGWLLAQELGMLLGERLERPVLAREDDITDIINRIFGESTRSEGSVSDVLGDSVNAIDEFNEDAVEDLLEDSSEAPFIRLVNMILAQAVRAGASDIHIEPYRDVSRVRFRLDGVLYERHTLNKAHHAAVVSRIKVMAKLNIAEKRLPQDGRIAISLGGRQAGLRVSTLPTSFGERVVLRLLEKSERVLSLTELGLSREALQLMHSLVGITHGIVLVTGPTGSGKTTTLYMVLQEVAQRQVNVSTIEDPVERNLDRINQTQVNNVAGLTFESGLRALLRQDPDVIMVGETRDAETASISVRAAITGHMVFSTLHTNDALSSIVRLEDMGVERYMIANSLAGVVAQRLMRRVCPACARKVPATEAEAELLGPSIPFVARGTGCPQCNGTGYKGRVAIHEMVVINKALRRMIAEGASIEEMTDAARKSQGMRSLRESAVQLVRDGVTTPEELLKITYFEE